MPLLVALGLAGALIQTPAGTDATVVSGRVLEQATHAPVAGAQVMLMMQFQGPPPLPIARRPATATTDENGRFAFVGIEPGRYRLNTQKAGFASSIGEAGSPSVEVTAGQRREDLEITLQRGGAIAGRVVDQSGQPVVDASVMVLRKPPMTPASSPRPGSSVTADGPGRFANRLLPGGPGAQTNDLGEFRLHSLQPGEYYVQAAPRTDFGGSQSAAGTPAGATTMVPTFFPGTADSTAAQPIVVSAGQTSGDVEVRMIVASASRVSGVVVDEAGRPLVNALVRLMARDANDGFLAMMRRPSQARTDAKGAFAIGTVTNGAYTLIAVPRVVVATAPQRGGGGAGGITAGTFWSSSGGGRMGGDSTSGAVTTESVNGITAEYRDDAGTRLAVDVNDGDVTGLQVVVHRPDR